METGEVKFSKSGSNGVQHMTYDRKVADFNTFIKSPEKFIKGTSVKTTDKVSHQGGDFDYKQLFAKIKMVGEQITALSAEVAKDPSKAKALNEAIAEMGELNKKLLEFAQPPAQSGDAGGAGGDYRAKLQAKINEYVQKLPDAKKEEVIAQVEPELAGKSETDIQAIVQPNEAKAQEIVDAAAAEVKANESLIVEGFWSGAGDFIKKAVNTLFVSAESLGALAFMVSTIAYGVTDGHPGELLKMIGEFGGIGALASFILHGIWTALMAWRDASGSKKK